MRLYDSAIGNLINTRPKRFEGRFSRVGVFPYVINGRLLWQYRPADEVLDPESVESFYDAALTISHPEDDTDEEPVHCHGAVIDVTPNADELAIDGTFIVMTDEALKKAKDGSPLSPMYDVILREENGVFDGKPYDLVQTNIRYTSLGLVPAGRQGDEVKVFYQLSKDALAVEPKNETEIISVPSLKIPDFETQIVDAMGKPLGKTDKSKTPQGRTAVTVTETVKNHFSGGKVLNATIQADSSATDTATETIPVTEKEVETTNTPNTGNSTEGGSENSTTVENSVENSSEGTPSTETATEDVESLKKTIANLEALLKKSSESGESGDSTDAKEANSTTGDGDEKHDEDATKEESITDKSSDNGAATADGQPEGEGSIESDAGEGDSSGSDQPASDNGGASDDVTPAPVEASGDSPDTPAEPIAVINSDGGVNVNRDYLDDAVGVAQHTASLGIMDFEDALHIGLSSSYVLKKRILAKASIQLSDWDDIDVAYKVYTQMHPPQLKTQTVSGSSSSTTNSDSAPAATSQKTAQKKASSAPPPLALPTHLADSQERSPVSSATHPKHGSLNGNTPATQTEDSSGYLTFDDIE